jgi:hypothetical protein
MEEYNANMYMPIHSKQTWVVNISSINLYKIKDGQRRNLYRTFP